MSKSKKLKRRIIAILLMVLGLVLGVTWNHAGYCVGDELFVALGLSPWSNGTGGTHYPAVIGTFMILAGMGILNGTLQKKTRFWIWTGVVLVLVLLNFVLAYI